MRVLIAGMDGYLGWALAQYLTARGHEVGGADAYYRRQWVAEMKSQSATPIFDMPERLKAFKEKWGIMPYFKEGDLTKWDFIKQLFEEFKPEAIVHFGQCPSAPYSMIDVMHANWVQTNNMTSTINMIYAMRDITPNAHMVKLGTMGEYGTPNLDIPEGYFEIEYRGRKERLAFPRQAGSWYHWSKVHDTNNMAFACRLWGLRATDIMQGVVYGTRIDEMGDDERLLTRLDFDECFGTAINRYCCQAVIGEALTPFGAGHQKRGFLPLRDSMQCLTIAIENPAQESEARVFNQFEEVYDVTGLANKVQKVGREFGLDVVVRNIENPRKEMEEHYYNPDHKHLLDLGYKPTHDMESELKIVFTDLIKYRKRIEAVKDVLIPQIRWDGTKRKSKYL